MNQEFFDQAQDLLTVLEEVQATGRASLTAEQQHTMRRVYSQISPGVQLDLSCSTCILHYLNMLLAWFEREYPKHQQRQTFITFSEEAKQHIQTTGEQSTEPQNNKPPQRVRRKR